MWLGPAGWGARGFSLWGLLVAFGGITGTVRTCLAAPMAPTDLLNLPLGLGDGGWGRPREKVALLLAGRTESLRGLIGGGGGWGSETLGLRFFLLSSIWLSDLF